MGLYDDPSGTTSRWQAPVFGCERITRKRSLNPIPFVSEYLIANRLRKTVLLSLMLLMMLMLLSSLLLMMMMLLLILLLLQLYDCCSKNFVQAAISLNDHFILWHLFFIWISKFFINLSLILINVKHQLKKFLTLIDFQKIFFNKKIYPGQPGGKNECYLRV